MYDIKQKNNITRQSGFEYLIDENEGIFVCDDVLSYAVIVYKKKKVYKNRRALYVSIIRSTLCGFFINIYSLLWKQFLFNGISTKKFGNVDSQRSLPS